jgi:hypothetical protein
MPRPICAKHSACAPPPTQNTPEKEQELNIARAKAAGTGTVEGGEVFVGPGRDRN